MKALFLAASAVLGFDVGSAGAGGGILIRDTKVTEMRRRRPGECRPSCEPKITRNCQNGRRRSSA